MSSSIFGILIAVLGSLLTLVILLSVYFTRVEKK